MNFVIEVFAGIITIGAGGVMVVVGVVHIVRLM